MIRRDGREARGNEEREKGEDEKGSHCFFKSSGYDKLELKHQNLVFFKLMECIIKMSWCETECNKTLGRARDPRANGAWLSKLTE